MNVDLAMALVVVIATTFLPSNEMCITFFLSVDYLDDYADNVNCSVTNRISDDDGDGLVLFSSCNCGVDRIGVVANYGDLRLVCDYVSDSNYCVPSIKGPINSYCGSYYVFVISGDLN